MSYIAPILLDWYAQHGRDLPWRCTRDPYLIWISEVVLQQTRVAQGMDYYLRFVERFPNVTTLAAAPQDEVMKLWQGLGYYSRARNLHAAAKQIIELFGGQFPVTYKEVLSLRGVGDYTAAAICSAAYDLPHAVVDGNVCRVLSRLFDLQEPIDTTAGRRQVVELAQSELDADRAGLYNQAIMDFGAVLCTPAQPRCGECPFVDRCLAQAAGTIGERPAKQGRTKVRERWFNYLHVLCNGRTFIHRREGRDIWQGLYDFPLIESLTPLEFRDLAATPAFGQWLGDTRWRQGGLVTMPPHQLSHQTIYASFHRLEVDVVPPSMAACVQLDEALVGEYAVPRLIDRYLSK